MNSPLKSRRKIARPYFGHSLTNVHLPTAIASYQITSDHFFILNTNIWTKVFTLSISFFIFGSFQTSAAHFRTKFHYRLRQLVRDVASAAGLADESHQELCVKRLRPVVAVLFGFLICSQFSFFLLTCSLSGENWRPL